MLSASSISTFSRPRRRQRSAPRINGAECQMQRTMRSGFGKSIELTAFATHFPTSFSS